MTNDIKRICVGIIIGPHGVRGQVKVGTYTEEPEALFDYAPLTDETGARVFDLTPRGVGTDHFIVSIKGVTTREGAEGLKRTKLYVTRDQLPPSDEGEYYLADLVGLTAQNEKGETIGVVEETHDYGAGVFLEIKPPHAKSFMLPFKDAFVPQVDIAARTMQVVIPEGWLTQEKEPKAKKAKETND